jgi:hypothetical protein
MGHRSITVEQTIARIARRQHGVVSYQFHNSRYSWEQDHERRREAYDRGDTFRTYTWKDVDEDPTRMLKELNELLRG